MAGAMRDGRWVVLHKTEVLEVEGQGGTAGNEM